MIIKDDILLRRDVHTLYFVIAKTEQESYHVRAYSYSETPSY